MKLITLTLFLSAVCTPAVSQNSSNSGSESAANITQNSSVPEEQQIDTTSSGIAPGLTAAGVHSCAGSASGGMGMTGINFGVGSTKEMVECNRRAYAASLQGLGQNAAALDVICQNEEVRHSLNVTGVICPSQRAAARAAAQQAETRTVQASTHGNVMPRQQVALTSAQMQARGCTIKISQQHGRHWACPNGFRNR